jgi:DNA-directed RNA polymerase subunit RPC12/RpoP
MIKKITEWGNCSRCRKKITDNTIGDIIEAEEVIVCDSCAKKHRLYIIAEINKFRQSKDFNNIIALRKKLLWLSEQMGNWHDAGDKFYYIESVYEYNKYNIYELQFYLISDTLCIIDTFFLESENYDRKIKPKLKNLREELRKEYDKISSYINIKEYINK